MCAFVTVSIATLAVYAQNIQAAARQRPAASAPAPSDVDTTAEFVRRVEAYAAQRATLQQSLPQLPASGDAQEVHRATTALADAVRRVRKTAAAGDIFSPRISTTLRKRIADAIKGRDVEEVLASLREDDDLDVAARAARTAVNGTYPGVTALATIPPAILAALPPLPRGLRYGFVHTTLVLWDDDAGVVIDVLPRAFSAR